MSSSNPFDIIASFVDGKATHEENCKKLGEHLDKGEIPVDAVCSVLATAVSMPAMYAELLKTREDLRNCRYDLEECLATLAAYQEHERDDAHETKPRSRNREVVN